MSLRPSSTWRSAASALLLLTACAVPGYDASGLELSWYLVESNLADGESGLRLRTCEGSLVSNVTIEVSDLDDPGRTGRFEYTCAEGYRTPTDFFVSSSPVFIDLRPGRYSIALEAWNDPEANGGEGTAALVTRGELELRLEGSEATLLPFQITPAPVDLQLDLSGLDACDEISTRLMVPVPGEAFADPLSGEDDEPVAYRDGLSDGAGWRLDGEPRQCAGLEPGLHTFRDLDRGAYLLRVRLDGGSTCDVPIRLDRPNDGADDMNPTVPLALDLANLPC